MLRQKYSYQKEIGTCKKQERKKNRTKVYSITKISKS